MIVDLEEKTESGVFDIKGGGKVHVRLLTSNDFKAIRKACVTKVVEYPLLGEGAEKKYQRFESEKFDAELFNAMSWDLGITGWENIFDRNEKPIPVTKENKTLLMVLCPEFREAVDNGFAALKEAEKVKTETEAKN
jgi:hypothetical protein